MIEVVSADSHWMRMPIPKVVVESLGIVWNGLDETLYPNVKLFMRPSTSIKAVRALYSKQYGHHRGTKKNAGKTCRADPRFTQHQLKSNRRGFDAFPESTKSDHVRGHQWVLRSETGCLVPRGIRTPPSDSHLRKLCRISAKNNTEDKHRRQTPHIAPKLREEPPY